MSNLSETQVSTLSRIEPRVFEREQGPLRKRQRMYASLGQLIRFALVGILNTGVDILLLNLLLWRFPTHNANLLLAYNSFAYTLGAINSFYCNKYWTFKQGQKTTSSELLRFTLISLLGIICNDGIIWIVARVLHPLIASNFLWANGSKGVAVIGTATISYLGMRLWVFAGLPREKMTATVDSTTAYSVREEEIRERSDQHIQVKEQKMSIAYSLTVVMPAHNEEVAIMGTMRSVIAAVSLWTQDFEVIVVNDGSKDQTRAILEEIAAEEPRVRIINHEMNKGYGAALVSGFQAASKDLVFFMDSDGQFDICDLERFFPLIGQYDAVLGYRIDRQDTWLRKLNAWGWKVLVQCVFKLRVRDIDCAFKLYKATFFQQNCLETRGAMINTEMLYKFARAGYTYTEVGVQHLPRRGGRATGAKLSVIARAFRELFVYAQKWHHEEQKQRIMGKRGTL
ncbi:MAG: hypothetical protein NVS4B11_31520 [Ktedonobacteraceae bacterium]